MPPVMLKRVDGGFVDPVQDASSKRAQREHTRVAKGFNAMRTGVDDYYSQKSKKGKLSFMQRTHPYTQLQRLAESVRLDPQRGHFKTPGIDSELEDFLQTDYNEFETFGDYFAALHSQLGFQSDYELAHTLVHSVALQFAPTLAERAKGLILARSLDNLTQGALQPDGTPLTVEALVGKVALRLVHEKVRSIVAGKQQGSAYQRAGLLDFFLRDSYVPRPSADVVQWLREQVYPDSLGSGTDTLSYAGPDEDFAERLQRNYFEAKAAAICRFLGLDENQVLRVDRGATTTDFGALFTLTKHGAPEPQEDKDYNEKRLMIAELKALLAHKDVIRTLDSKIAKLEQALRLYDSRPPVAERVAQQLDLLLHSLPSRLKARYLGENSNAPSSFDPRYLGRSFNNLQLQWHALDLDFPADIMPVQEYIEHQRTMDNIHLLVPPGSYFEERLHETRSRLVEERVTDSGDDEELARDRLPRHYVGEDAVTLELDNVDVSPRARHALMMTLNAQTGNENGKMDEEDDEEEAQQASVKELEESFGPGMVSLREVARRTYMSHAQRKADFPLGEQAEAEMAEVDEEQMMGAEPADERGDEEEMEQGDEMTDEDAKKKRKEERMQQIDEDREKVAFLDLYRAKHIDVFNERTEARLQHQLDSVGRPVMWQRATQHSMTMHSERLLSTLMSSASEHVEHFSVIAQLENAREDDLETQFDRLPQDEKKSVTLFRELKRPVYFKHYVAQAFREFYAHNPYDHSHFVEDSLNPNLGFYLGSPIDPNAVATGETARDDLRAYKPRLAVVTPLSATANSRSRPRMNFFGRGKRKTSEAFAVVTSPGTGKVSVNNREFIEYFGLESSRFEVLAPLIMADRTCHVDLKLFVSGGGVSGQATACTVAVAKALVKAFPELQKPFYDNYMMWTDSRQVERKKTGKYKARKSYTYVRR